MVTFDLDMQDKGPRSVDTGSDDRMQEEQLSVLRAELCPPDSHAEALTLECGCIWRQDL